MRKRTRDEELRNDTARIAAFRASRLASPEECDRLLSQAENLVSPLDYIDNDYRLRVLQDREPVLKDALTWVGKTGDSKAWHYGLRLLSVIDCPTAEAKLRELTQSKDAKRAEAAAQFLSERAKHHARAELY